MTSDPPPTCRPCEQRGIITLATWVRNDAEVQNWTVCDRHAGMLENTHLVRYGPFTKLPTPVILPTGTRTERE